MGNILQDSSSKKPFQYGVFLDGPEREGETKILRRPDTAKSGLIPSDVYNLGCIIRAFDRCLNKFPNREFLGTRKYISKDKYGDYQWRTYKDIDELSDYFLYGIHELGLCPEIESDMKGEKYKFFGIYSKNREEWIIADLACQKNSITVVTVYDTLGLGAVEFIFKQTLLTSLIMESKSLKNIIKLKKENKLSNLVNIVVISCEDDPELETNFKMCQELGLNMYHYDDVIKLGKKYSTNNSNKPEFKRATPDTIMTFCYTSGTTGNPKGAMIPNNCIMAAVTAMKSIGITLNDTDVYLSFLPLAHIMEQLIFAATLIYGCKIGFFTGSPLHIVDDAKALKPTFFCGVPRIFTKLYEVIMKTINNNPSQVKKRIALKAIETKLYNYEKYGVLKHIVYDRLVFDKIRSTLGGNLKWMLVGSAPIKSEILKFLRIAFCCPIVEGYGQTEDCAGVLLSNINDTSAGHLGGLSGCCELKLVDVPELGYSTKDRNSKGEWEPRGEICIRGSNVFKGYYKEPEKTRETIDKDGWLHSGDVGLIMTSFGNAIKIIDRAKNIFKLSQGEYVASEKVEGILANSKYVEQIFIHGEGVQSYIVAIVSPNKGECVTFLKEKGIDTTKEEVQKYYSNEELIKEVLKDMDQVGRSNDLKGFEIPKRVYLTAEQFSIDNNMLTPTMKLKTVEIMKRYKKEIENMYS